MRLTPLNWGKSMKYFLRKCLGSTPNLYNRRIPQAGSGFEFSILWPRSFGFNTWILIPDLVWFSKNRILGFEIYHDGVECKHIPVLFGQEYPQNRLQELIEVHKSPSTDLCSSDRAVVPHSMHLASRSDQHLQILHCLLIIKFRQLIKWSASSLCSLILE